MKLVIVRHGEPDYEKDSLTPKGWREAKLLADRLCREPADAYYCSPLGRARDTARDTLHRLGREATALPWLREFSGTIINPRTGEESIIWDQMPQYWTRCPEFFDAGRWLENPLIQTGDSAAMYQEVCDGLDALLMSYGYVRRGMLYEARENCRKTLVLFCHFGVTMMMLSHLLGLSPIPLLHGLILPPTSVSTLATEERRKGEVFFRCCGLGDVSHLYCADEPPSRSGRFGEVYEDGYAVRPFIHD